MDFAGDQFAAIAQHDLAVSTSVGPVFNQDPPSKPQESAFAMRDLAI